MGLQILHGLHVTGPVERMRRGSRNRRPVGAVKPHLGNITVPGQQFGNLCHEHVVILRGTVAGRVAIPRRNIESQFHAVFVARLAKHLHDIALAVFPTRRRHRMRGRLRGPQAEPVVMLCRQHHQLESGILQRTDPLIGIEFARIEHIGILGPVTPFLTCPGIDRKVDECGQLPALPLQLGRSRNQPGCHIHLLFERSRSQIDEFLEIFRILLDRVPRRRNIIRVEFIRCRAADRCHKHKHQKHSGIYPKLEFHLNVNLFVIQYCYSSSTTRTQSTDISYGKTSSDGSQEARQALPP